MTRRAVRPPSPRWFWAFVLCVALSGALVWARTAFRKPPPSYIDRLLTLPEDQIDVARVALEISKSFHPDLNVRYYLWRVDELAKRVAQVAAGTEDPEERIQALNTVFFKERGFGYDFRSLKEDRAGERYLERLLDTRRGTCYTLPMLYMAVAQRLGYPIYAVLAPGHCFLRYEASELRYINIEVTTGGGECPDEVYQANFGVTPRAQWMESYLQTLTNRRYLGVLLLNASYARRAEGRPDQAAYLLEQARALHPTCPEIYAALNGSYRSLAMMSTGATAARSAELAEKYAEATRLYQHVPMSEIPIIKNQEQARP